MRLKNTLKGYYNMYRWLKAQCTNRSKFGYIGENSIYEEPCHIEYPSNFYLEDNAKIRHDCIIINSNTEKVVIKKYSVVAAGSVIVTNSHRSTVGIPHFILGGTHINDKSADVIIEEDVWIGARAIILAGVTVGRGAIVAAGAIVTKSIPPYALVVGSPAKIVAVKFAINDIVRHEQELYPESERLSKEYLEDLFEKFYKNCRVFGVNEELTEEQLKRIDRIKRMTRFKSWK